MVEIFNNPTNTLTAAASSIIQYTFVPGYFLKTNPHIDVHLNSLHGCGVYALLCEMFSPTPGA